MNDIKVDHRDHQYLVDRAADEIRRAIGHCELKPGERLPPVRDLPGVPPGVNTNVALCALFQLRAEGLLEFGRSLADGITVIGHSRKRRRRRTTIWPPDVVTSRSDPAEARHHLLARPTLSRPLVP